ncbi:MAG: hypothetical protein HQK96_20750 [Nitrospirae bacterium]|nr:hypothetical protein [Nitrospirota bacterium]
MDISQRKLQEHSIVLIGDFNPAIFQPLWLASVELISKSDAEAAEIDIISKKAAIFTVGEIRIEVLQTRFQAQTIREDHFETLRDLVVGIFGLLNFTPITQIGINIAMHFLLDSEDKWHEVGHTLAPKKIWEGVLNNPGMTDLSMIEDKRRDGYKGRIMVMVQPSVRYNPGLYFFINDHFEAEGNRDIITILEKNWKISIDRSREIISKLLTGLL